MGTFSLFCQYLASNSPIAASLQQLQCSFFLRIGDLLDVDPGVFAGRARFILACVEEFGEFVAFVFGEAAEVRVGFACGAGLVRGVGGLRGFVSALRARLCAHGLFELRESCP